MDRFIYINGQIVDASNASLSPANAGLLYGWGVFTILRIDAGRVFAFERYWQRLEKHAEKAGVPILFGPDEIRSALRQLIAANNIQFGRARITVVRSGAGVWSIPSQTESDLLIFTSGEQVRRADDAALTVSPYRTISHGPLAGVKRAAMLENLLALEEARARGFSEAVMFNERGEMVGATAANLFWAVSDHLFTPSPATGCVLGITRHYVLEIANKLKLTVEEGSFPVQRLLDAAEVFLTSTGRGVVVVNTFDVVSYDPDKGWVGKLMKREFQKLIDGDRIHW